ncbi:MAG: cell wall-binding repeat-containing protein [Solirubrobacteraceae bacterium]
MKRIFMPLAVSLVLCGCGSRTVIFKPPPQGVPASTPHATQAIGFPAIATKNTTRVDGADPIVNAAGVALAEYPSAARGTHPSVVVLAPTDDWQAAIASSALSAPPFRAPILLSDSGSLASATSDALTQLSPSGSGAAGGAQVIAIGDVPKPKGEHVVRISGRDPFTVAAGIDRFATAAAGRPSPDVVIASADQAPYAMPAAGWAGLSGDPILFVTSSSVPKPTQQALLAHQHPHIYILGPTKVIPQSVAKQLSKYGKVKRISGNDPASSSVAFAVYRDPPCAKGQPCAHVPGSFGWALRSPGHGYVLVNQSQPLDAAAAAPLSASGSFGAQLILDSASTLPQSILNFFLNYATPGFTEEGPTAAVYNHAWIIGNEQAISVPVQAEVDALLEAVPQK